MNPLDARDDGNLPDLLQRLRDDEAHREPPAHVRAAVMAAWDAAASASVTSSSVTASCVAPSSVVSGFSRTIAALAAGLVLVVGLARLGSGLRSGVAMPPPVSTATVHLVGEPFAEGEAVRVVRMRMAPAMLASLGIRSTAGDDAESVDVDVIVGEDGVARAIRLELGS